MYSEYIEKILREGEVIGYGYEDKYESVCSIDEVFG